MTVCPVRDDLQQKAAAVLERIVQLTHRQIEAIKTGDARTLMAADKEVELAFGEKERTFGALNYHREEHGC
jgi:hypothetical protein